MESNQNFQNKLKNEILIIRSQLFSKFDNEQKEKFKGLEQVYEMICQQSETEIKDSTVECQDIYGQFLKKLKQFKRRCENQFKFQERDVDAFRKKWEQTGQQFVPVIHDIKMKVSDRLGQFDIEKLKDPDFQMHLYTNKELCEIAFKMFEHQGFLQGSTINSNQFQALLNEMCINYNVISYHNWTHAFALTQMLFCCYYQSDLKNFLQPFDMFSIMLAGLAHDMNHKGVNNLYKVKKRAQKAMIYSDQAVLENMSIAHFFQILLKNPDLDITKTLGDQPTVMNFKRLFISSILATDMGRHNKFVNKLKQRRINTINFRNQKENATDLDKYFNLKSELFEDRRFICNIMVHACDIGNPCLQFNNYMNWSYLLSQEFYDQTLKEEKMGLEVTMMLKYKDKLTFFNGQTFFSKILLLPLWQEIALIFPQLEYYPKQILSNLERIEEEKQKLQGQK